jgi:hypothetical protein
LRSPLIVRVDPNLAYVEELTWSLSEKAPLPEIKDWRAHAEWLRLSFPGDYRGNANKIEVSATAQASSIVLTEEERLELIERQRAAEGLPDLPDEITTRQS